MAAISPTRFITRQVSLEMRKHLPVLIGWFTEISLRTGVLGAFLAAVTAQVVEWLLAIRLAAGGVFLLDAEGDDLDLWGDDIQVPRREDESDDDYRPRLQAQILQLRLTKTAIEAFITSNTGLDTEVLLPWKQEHIWGISSRSIVVDETGDGEAEDLFYGRSGSTVRSSHYYQGGVIDIKTWGYSPDTKLLAPDVVAGGIKVYFTVQLEEDIQPLSTPQPDGSMSESFGLRQALLPEEASYVFWSGLQLSDRSLSWLPYVEDFWSTHFTVDDLSFRTWLEAQTGLYEQAASDYSVTSR